MSPEDPALAYLRMAMYLDAAKEKVAPGTAHGMVLRGLRERTTPEGHPLLSPEEVERCNRRAAFELRFIKAIEPKALPVPPYTVATMIDALSFALGVTTRAEAWAIIGLSPASGRGWLAEDRGGIKRWAPFMALRASLLNRAEHPAPM